MNSVQAVVLYGASGHAGGIHDEYALGASPLITVAAFIDDLRGDRGERFDGAPVIGFETWRSTYRALPCFVTVGDPAARRALVERVADAGGTFCTLSRVDEVLSPSVAVGEGSLVAQYVTIGPSTAIGRHTHLMPFVSIDRACAIGDYVTICPSVTIQGRVTVGDEVFIGAGATIANALDEPLAIGRGAMLYAGAVVTESVPAGARRVGNPATDPRALARRIAR